MSWTAHQQAIQQQQQHVAPQILQTQQLPAPNLASHFHLLPLIEAIADATERGVRDQHVEDLVNELASRFERCQQFLAPHAQSSKPVTLRSQKLKLLEYENRLNMRREALAKYKDMVEKAAML